MTDGIRLGFIGLGVMGGRMCRNLVRRSGLPVVAFDPVPSSAQAVADVGGTIVASAAEVMVADIVFLCLPGEPQVRAVCLEPGGLVEHARTGQTIVDMTTATVEIDREVAAALASRGADFADAPIARGVPAAEDGTLAITVGASEEVFARIKPLLAHMGSEISHCGDVGTGQVLKLMNNMLLFQNVSALAEAMAIATRAGVAREKLFPILERGSADSFAMRRHGSFMTSGEYPDDWFPTRYAKKDLGYAIALAESVGVDARGAKVVGERFDDIIERGLGEYYSPVIYRLFEDDET
jgi:3-hydroxyisobutyrate dehydrogenase